MHVHSLYNVYMSYIETQYVNIQTRNSLFYILCLQLVKLHKILDFLHFARDVLRHKEVVSVNVHTY